MKRWIIESALRSACLLGSWPDCLDESLAFSLFLPVTPVMLSFFHDIGASFEMTDGYVAMGG